MNNYVRSEDAVAFSTVSAITLEEASNDVRAPSVRRASVAWQSGLPMVMRGSLPERVVETRSRAINLAIKRAMDLLVAALATILLLPLLVIVAVIIKLSSKGPVFFHQEREGLHGSIFKAYKFRSMRIEDCDPTGVAQTLQDDPRITWIGRFIRKTSIDELPQLINILRGEMSLVGPRPHVAGMYAGGVLYKNLVPYYEDRLAMLPGLSGWAQANGLRGPTIDAEMASRRIDHDIAYVQNFSVLLDVKIIVMTIWNEFVTGSGH